MTITLQHTKLIALEVSASLLGTIAAFIPLKAILLLAAGTVPDIFPQQFQEYGPYMTSLILIGVGIVAALLASLAFQQSSKLRSNLRLREELVSSYKVDDVSAFHDGRGRRSTLQSEFIVASIFALLLSILSLPFLFASVLWLTTSYYWIRRTSFSTSATTDPSKSLVDAQIKYEEFVKQHTVAATIGISLVVLLVSSPRLGTTGVLLAVVACRSLQLAGSRVVGAWMRRAEWNSRARALSEGRPSDVVEKSLVVRLALNPQESGLETVSCRISWDASQSIIFGTRGIGRSLTLAPSGSECVGSYIRLFPKSSHHVWALEREFRTTQSPVPLFPEEKLEAFECDGAWALAIQLSEVVCGEAQVSRKMVLNKCRDILASCIGSHEFQEWAEPREVHFPAAEFEFRVTSACSLPGAHMSGLSGVLAALEEVEEELAARPLAWATDRLEFENGFLARIGGVIIASPLGWHVGRFEALWTRLPIEARLEVAEVWGPPAEASGVDAFSHLDHVASIAVGRQHLLNALRHDDLHAAAGRAAHIKDLIRMGR